MYLLSQHECLVEKVLFIHLLYNTHCNHYVFQNIVLVFCKKAQLAIKKNSMQIMQSINIKKKYKFDQLL